MTSLVRTRDRDSADPIDARAIVQLEQRCAKTCGANHWTSKLLSLILVEATINLLWLELCVDLVRLLRVRLIALVQWLTVGQQPGYLVGEFVTEGVRLVQGTIEEPE